MPAGPSTFGFAYFIAVKYAGYTAYCRWAIQPRLQPSEHPVRSAWVAGAIRTAIGVVIGITVGLQFWRIPYFASNHDNLAEALFYGSLVPLRIGEWWLLIRLAYNGLLSRNQRFALIGGGILTSFALDFIGVVSAFALPGGMWIC
jgi:hypothetical protein